MAENGQKVESFAFPLRIHWNVCHVYSLNEVRKTKSWCWSGSGMGRPRGKTYFALNSRLINATADEWNYWLRKCFCFALPSATFRLLAIFTYNSQMVSIVLTSSVYDTTRRQKCHFINVKWHINIPCWDVNCISIDTLSQFQSLG